MRTRAALAAAFACIWVSAATAEVYKVDNLKDLDVILAEKAAPGDVVEIQPGHYYPETRKIVVGRSGTPDAPIIIRGIIKDGQRPIIDAEKTNVMRGVFVVPPTAHDIVFENLEMINAAGSRFADRDKWGHNAAPIYFEGCKNVTARNCLSHHNENGFFATHDADYILIENCDIHHNGTTSKEQHNSTHNFYFQAHHQMVKNSHIGSANEAENFKSRGANTIFAFNWVDEDYAYSVSADSGNSRNMLWLGNVIMKRTYQGITQGRLFGMGDGTGVASGTIVALNNTFITVRPRDFYLFTEKSSTGDFVLLNNVFWGPGEQFMDKNGSGTITGRRNWLPEKLAGIPESVTDDSIVGEDPGFVDAAALDFRPKAGSPLIDKGISQEDYMKAVRVVTDNARTGTDVAPSATWLKALAEIEAPYPMYEPTRTPGGTPRKSVGPLDIGAFEYAE